MKIIHVCNGVVLKQTTDNTITIATLGKYEGEFEHSGMRYKTSTVRIDTDKNEVEYRCSLVKRRIDGQQGFFNERCRDGH